jgi:hypothetical protein
MTHDIENPGIANATNESEEHEEIEITEEMIEAGIAKLMSWNHRFDSEEDAVTRIYLAMVKAKNPGKKGETIRF